MLREPPNRKRRRGHRRTRRLGPDDHAIIKEFIGISDPYEAPADAEITIDTTSCSPEEAAGQIIDYLKAEGYLAA